MPANGQASASWKLMLALKRRRRNKRLAKLDPDPYQRREYFTEARPDGHWIMIRNGAWMRGTVK